MAVLATGPFVPGNTHLHRTLREALTCGGTQAFLPLPIGATYPDVVVLPDVRVSHERGTALVQFRACRHLSTALGGWFRSGRLAVRWNELDTGPVVHERLTAECRVIWSALRRSTSPATLVAPTGRTSKAQRFGPAALAFDRAPDARLARGTLTGVQLLEP